MQPIAISLPHSPKDRLKAKPCCGASGRVFCYCPYKTGPTARLAHALLQHTPHDERKERGVYRNGTAVARIQAVIRGSRELPSTSLRGPGMNESGPACDRQPWGSLLLLGISWTVQFSLPGTVSQEGRVQDRRILCVGRAVSIDANERSLELQR